MNFEQFITFDINYYSALLLIVLLVTIYLKRDVYSFSSKMFKIIIITNIAMLILEIFSWTYDGVEGQLAMYLNYTFNFCLILLTPVISCFWATYIDHKIFNSLERIKRRHYYLYPFLIGVFLSVINITTPILFSISEDNVYSREPLIWINAITMYLLLLYIIALTFKNRKLVNQEVALGVTIFMILPAVGAAIQIVYLGLFLIWPMMALGVIVAYIFLETTGTSRDHLTKLFTRLKSDEYIKNLIDRQTEFAIIMIDLDNFKELNDTYGHAEGDRVLQIFGIILMNVFDKNSLVSRFGGDEFLIITNTYTEKELIEFKKLIYDELSNTIYLNEHLKSLKFSYGYSCFIKGDVKTMDHLIVEADDFMYKDKAFNKNYKRRRSDR